MNCGVYRKRMDMTINSKQKGKRGELELKNELNKYGYETHRGQQYCGSSGNADVVGLPGIHIECKRVEKLNINNAMKQAENDAKINTLPVVFSKKSRELWLVTMKLDDWMKLYKSYRKDDDGTEENSKKE